MGVQEENRDVPKENPQVSSDVSFLLFHWNPYLFMFVEMFDPAGMWAVYIYLLIWVRQDTAIHVG